MLTTSRVSTIIALIVLTTASRSIAHLGRSECAW